MTRTFYTVNILRIFFPVTLFLGCQNSNYEKRVREFPVTKISNNWSLRLPYKLKETGLKGKFYQRAYASPTDSITLEVSTGNIDVKESLEYFQQAVDLENRGKDPAPCLGSFEGYSKFYNFIDSTNMLSGFISNFEENGRWIVAFEVRSAKTGDELSLGFEKVSPNDIKLLHEAIKSIRYNE